jgi:hypothetical protein
MSARDLSICKKDRWSARDMLNICEKTKGICEGLVGSTKDWGCLQEGQKVSARDLSSLLRTKDVCEKDKGCLQRIKVIHKGLVRSTKNKGIYKKDKGYLQRSKGIWERDKGCLRGTCQVYKGRRVFARRTKVVHKKSALVAVSQSCTVLSRDANASSLESGEKATELTSLLCPSSVYFSMPSCFA